MVWPQLSLSEDFMLSKLKVVHKTQLQLTLNYLLDVRFYVFISTIKLS